MPATLVCQTCSRAYTVKPELAGKKAKCKCGATVRFPDADSASGSGAFPQENSISSADLGNFEGDHSPLETVKTCPQCNRPLARNSVLCLNCGYDPKPGKSTRTQILAPPPLPTPARGPAAYSSGGGRAGTGNMLIGGLICVGGTIATVLGYQAAANNPNGGSYMIFWGAIIFGAIRFIKGLIQYTSGG